MYICDIYIYMWYIYICDIYIYIFIFIFILALDTYCTWLRNLWFWSRGPSCTWKYHEALSHRNSTVRWFIHNHLNPFCCSYLIWDEPCECRPSSLPSRRNNGGCKGTHHCSIVRSMQGLLGQHDNTNIAPCTCTASRHLLMLSVRARQAPQ